MQAPPNAEVYETPLLNCWFGEDGILYSVSKVAERTIENYDILFELYKKLSKDGTKKICTLGNITSTQPMSKEVREYIALQFPKYIKAMALISYSPMGATIGKLFKDLQLSPYPIRMFEDEASAITWLRAILD
jgi:hypothetical protein